MALVSMSLSNETSLSSAKRLRSADIDASAGSSVRDVAGTDWSEQAKRVRRAHPSRVPVICRPPVHASQETRKLLVPETMTGREFAEFARKKCSWAVQESRLFVDGLPLPVELSMSQLDKQFRRCGLLNIIVATEEQMRSLNEANVDAEVTGNGLSSAHRLACEPPSAETDKRGALVPNPSLATSFASNVETEDGLCRKLSSMPSNSSLAPSHSSAQALDDHGYETYTKNDVAAVDGDCSIERISLAHRHEPALMKPSALSDGVEEEKSSSIPTYSPKVSLDLQLSLLEASFTKALHAILADGRKAESVVGQRVQELRRTVEADVDSAKEDLRAYEHLKTVTSYDELVHRNSIRDRLKLLAERIESNATEVLEIGGTSAEAVVEAGQCVVSTIDSAIARLTSLRSRSIQAIEERKAAIAEEVAKQDLDVAAVAGCFTHVDRFVSRWRSEALAEAMEARKACKAQIEKLESEEARYLRANETLSQCPQAAEVHAQATLARANLHAHDAHASCDTTRFEGWTQTLAKLVARRTGAQRWKNMRFALVGMIPAVKRKLLQ
eukprot:TRINITY_DN19470_c0_g6_i1.p1 TRINITY_DN19470_c0_g6~~TRINITY_DN19470_c0_g6_i1.p1  ORF type:complete len:564 (-),score=79.98 TRINITY_DN19470_c0_g6_i1:243-1910(-)